MRSYLLNCPFVIKWCLSHFFNMLPTTKPTVVFCLKLRAVLRLIIQYSSFDGPSLQLTFYCSLGVEATQTPSLVYKLIVINCYILSWVFKRASLSNYLDHMSWLPFVNQLLFCPLYIMAVQGASLTVDICKLLYNSKGNHLFYDHNALKALTAYRYVSSAFNARHVVTRSLCYTFATQVCLKTFLSVNSFQESSD